MTVGISLILGSSDRTTSAEFKWWQIVGQGHPDVAGGRPGVLKYCDSSATTTLIHRSTHFLLFSLFVNIL